MRNNELIELINEVDSINTDPYNQLKTVNKYGKVDCNPWVWMEIQYGTGRTTLVKFLDEYLWNSDTDERGYDYVTNEYEPIGQYLRNKANDLISKLQKIKL